MIARGAVTKEGGIFHGGADCPIVTGALQMTGVVELAVDPKALWGTKAQVGALGVTADAPCLAGTLHALVHVDLAALALVARVPAVTFVVGHKGLAASPVQTGAVQAEVNHFLAEGSPVAGDADTAKATPLSPALCPIKAGLACAEVTLVLAV